MPNLLISTPFNIDLEFETAAPGKRIAAYLVDLFLLVSYLYIMKYLLYEVFNLPGQEFRGMDILFIAMPMLFYSLLCEVLMNGQSFGKKLMQLRVISLDGGEPTFSQYLLRWITRFFEWPFFFGFIVFSPDYIVAYIFTTCLNGIAVVIAIAVTKKQQRIGDIMAGTVVIDTREKYGIDDSIFVEVNKTSYKVAFPEVMRLSDNDINTIKTVLIDAERYGTKDTLSRLEKRIKEILKISSYLHTRQFLEKLIEDYNYLATKE